MSSFIECIFRAALYKYLIKFVRQMTSLIYSVEAWVIAVIGWAWVTMRDFVPPNRSMLDNACFYSMLVVTTLHVGISALLREQV
jgi:hypothetical protein